MTGHHSRAWTLGILASLIPCLLAAGSTYAEQLQPTVIAASTFDVDAEGWSVSGDAQGGSGIPNYVPSGGNPGGYLSAVDDETGGVWYWEAPAKFLGNISGAYGYSLRFDLRQSATSQQREAPDLVLRDAAGRILYYNTPNNPGKTWTPYSVLLTETAGWTKPDATAPTQAEMKEMLADAAVLRIRGEFRSDTDIGDLDNVVLEGAVTPVAQLVTPQAGSTTGPGALQLLANLHNPSNVLVKNVEFVVLYDGTWHSAGVDDAAPYAVTWQIPNALQSQAMEFGVHMNSGFDDKIEYSGSVHTVDYLEYQGNPNVAENWVPVRAYLNQRPLTPDGASMSSVASMAMMLAMNGLIPLDQATMSAKAIEMYPYVLNAPYPDGDAVTTLMAGELVRQGLVAADLNRSANAAWAIVKQEIDSGRPVLLRTTIRVLTEDGHAIVVVGYREAADGSRGILAYDPYGKWKSTLSDYDANDRSDPLSHRGQWISYDFGTVFGPSNHLIIAKPAASGAVAVQAVPEPVAPDLISQEPDNPGQYDGAPILAPGVYLPFARK